MANFYATYPFESGTGGGGGGVTSLNGETGAVNLLAGTGISITPSGSNITIAATSTGGTVTSVSVVSANGLAGTVANPTTTPAITLSTTVTGILQGNGTSISAATTGNLTDAGTDGITVTGGTGAVLGSGTSLSQHVADATHNGYLASSDFNTFSGKQSTITIGALDAQAENANGLALVANVLSSQSADATHPGMVNNTTQTLSGNKTFTGATTDKSIVINGTAGTGFITLNDQSSTPSTPVSAITMFADATSRWTTLNPNGFTATWDTSGITANRVYTTRDVSGKILLDTRMSYAGFSVTTTPYTILSTDPYAIYFVNTTSAKTINLPAASSVADRVYLFKDVSGLANTNNISIVPNGADTVEGLNVTKLLQTNYGAWTFVSDGVSAWWMV